MAARPGYPPCRRRHHLTGDPGGGNGGRSSGRGDRHCDIVGRLQRVFHEFFITKRSLHTRGKRTELLARITEGSNAKNVGIGLQDSANKSPTPEALAVLDGVFAASKAAAAESPIKALALYGKTPNELQTPFAAAKKTPSGPAPLLHLRPCREFRLRRLNNPPAHRPFRC